MALNFHQPSLIGLFDANPLPLLMFNVTGSVTFANKAAKTHPGKPAVAMNGDPVIRALIRDATLGNVRLPYVAEIELEEGHKMLGQFMSGPVGLDIAFMAKSAGDSATSVAADNRQMSLKDTIELLRHELTAPMLQVEAQLKQVAESPLSSAVGKSLPELSNRIARLSDLIDVFGNNVMVTADRIEMLPLIRNICEELGAKADKLQVSFELVENEQTLPPIYGNKRLIRRAMYECLDNALTHSRKEVQSKQPLVIEVRFTLSGQHVLVSVRNKGATNIKITARDPVQPFAAAGTSSAVNKPEAVTRLGLPLVHRIVGLHGGNMRMNGVDEDTVQVLLEFPTGAPHRNPIELDIAQAQRYAHDLAQLMSRRKKESL